MFHGQTDGFEGGNPRIALIMLTWNQREMTLEGLAALKRLDGPPARILLLDNGSTDGTIEAVGETHPDVEIMVFPENLGFCAANNRGCSHVLKDQAIEYVLFLNNDIDLKPDCVRHLVDFMDRHPRAGACGPLINYYDPPNIVWAAGGRIFTDLMWFPPILRDKPDLGWHRPREVDYIHGCSLMVRRQVIEELGMFDERLFIYHDEVDWCLRMKKAGHEIWLVPKAKLYHKISQVVGQHSPMMIYYTARNKLLFWRKHGNFADLPKFYAFHLWKAIRIFSRVRNPWAFLSLIKAVVDSILGLFGKGHIERARNKS